MSCDVMKQYDMIEVSKVRVLRDRFFKLFRQIPLGNPKVSPTLTSSSGGNSCLVDAFFGIEATLSWGFWGSNLSKHQKNWGCLKKSLRQVVFCFFFLAAGRSTPRHAFMPTQVLLPSSLLWNDLRCSVIYRKTLDFHRSQKVSLPNAGKTCILPWQMLVPSAVVKVTAPEIKALEEFGEGYFRRMFLTTVMPGSSAGARGRTGGNGSATDSRAYTASWSTAAGSKSKGTVQVAKDTQAEPNFWDRSFCEDVLMPIHMK